MQPKIEDFISLPLNKVIVSWSGGIDSTAVLANLLHAGYQCIAVSSNLYRESAQNYERRESEARMRLMGELRSVAQKSGASVDFEVLESRFLWSFATPDGEIPQRNKRFIDLLMAKYLIPMGWRNLALGEYVGVDTWLVRDHVPPNDCDHRALSAYLLTEYGMRYRLISLQDFGESRYKSNRLKLGYRVIGEAMSLTTNCMANEEQDCGACYKCVERHAAFWISGIEDLTVYTKNPKDHPRFALYLKQMQGYEVSSSYHTEGK